MTEIEQQPPPQNGIDLTTEEDESNITRPADIEQDMREMDRRKRVEAIMGSKLFREELERIVDSQIREGGASGILQQLSDIVGVPASRVGSLFKSSNCVLPINDIRGIESMGYAKGEKILRCKLAATFRLLDLYGWTQGLGAQITARLNADQELFLVNPFGLLFHEVTASSLNKVDMQGNVVEQGTTNFGINNNHYILHSVVHSARPDIRCAIYLGCNPVVAVSSLKAGILPLTKDAALLGEIATHPYTGALHEPEEREKLVRNLGPISKVLLLSNHGAVCCGETIEEAFFAAYHIVQACETQLKLLPVGLDNLVLIPEESRKALYDASRRPPEGFEAFKAGDKEKEAVTQDNKEKVLHQKPKWRVGGAEYEALMRMLDNAGFRTGYIYRHPLVKSELPKPKNDVEVPPAVSSLGYLLEEEELYRQGIWKKGEWRKGGDRTKWLNSPNVYQKVEVLETGTPDPKKITKWVADGSPTHSNAVKIEHPLQFVPVGTNPKEFKRLQQQIKDNRRADKISAGPQSHILEGVTWDEANRIKENTVTTAGDHVVLMGAASKGIIQRGYQHNATVYKAPYAKNPFDNVTDDELNEYKKTVEKKKKNIHGEYTDTDFSESEALSSLQTSGAQQKNHTLSQSETEDASEHQVMRIETKQAPKPSQPEVVLSDASLINKVIIRNSSSQSFKEMSAVNEKIITIQTLKEALKIYADTLLLKKYEYLYKWPRYDNGYKNNCVVFIIHKVQKFPMLKSSYVQNTKNEIIPEPPKPYRTVSHFGFNYPIASGMQSNSEIDSNCFLPYKTIGLPKKCSTLFFGKLKNEEILPQFISQKDIDFVRCSDNLNNTHDDDLESLIESEMSLGPFAVDSVDESFQSDDKLNDLHLVRREFDLISEPESESTNRIFSLRNDLISVRKKRPLNFSQTTSETSNDEFKETKQNNSKSFQITIKINIENIDIKHFDNNDDITKFENLIRSEVSKIISNFPNTSVFIEIEKNPSVVVGFKLNKTKQTEQNQYLNTELKNCMSNVACNNKLGTIAIDTNLYRSPLFEYREKISILIQEIQKFLNDLYTD